jgi:hypothetical protein
MNLASQRQLDGSKDNKGNKGFMVPTDLSGAMGWVDGEWCVAAQHV